MDMEQRNLRTAAILLKNAHNALMRAELLATTEPETKQQIADVRASVEHTNLALHEAIRLKVAKVKPDVRNG